MGHELISIVPCPCLFKVHIISVTQFSDLIICKAKVLCQSSHICHGIFREHIKSRMWTIFFNRQYTCHVCKRYIVFILKPASQKIKVFLLRFFILRKFSKQTIPFINKNHKRPACRHKNILHYSHNIWLVPKNNILTLYWKIIRNVFAQHFKHIINTVCNTQKVLHINFEYIILVNMSVIRLIMTYFKAFK